MVADVVDRGNGHDEQRPDEDHKQSEMPGQRIRIERRMVIEMAPHLRREELDAAIEHRRGRHQQAEQRGIERGDIVEMHDLRPLAQEMPHAVCPADKGDEGKEDQQMGVGEEIDELADGIVGRHRCQQVGLAQPSEGQLVARHLHPDRVDGIRRHRADIGHHKMVALPQRDGVDEREHRHGLVAGRNLRAEDVGHGHHLVLLLENHQRVAAHHEVVALRVVVGGVEGDGVELLLGEIPGVWRDRALIVTGGEKK